MREPLVSVIVPVYKVEEYLCQCIESIINQCYQNLEVILIDDGSPDNCGVICDEFARRDNRIKVIHKENGGTSDARNAGLRVMSGEFIMFVDSDDWITPNYIRDLMSEGDFDLAIGGCTCFYESTENVKEISTGAESERFAIPDFKLVSSLMETSLFGYPFAKIYSRKLLDNIRFEYVYLREDLCFNISVWERRPSVYCCKSNGYMYRQRTGSALHNKYAGRLPDIVGDTKKMMVNFDFFTKRENRALTNTLIVTYLVDMIYKCIINNDTLTENERIRAIRIIYKDKVIKKTLKLSWKNKLYWLFTITNKLNLYYGYYLISMRLHHG